METISDVQPLFPDIVFVNPAAGGGHASDSLPSLQAFAKRSVWNVEFRTTDSAQDLCAQAQSAAAEGYSRFFILGGDGSFQDLVNALAGFPDVILGILPAGGGNDLADSLGLPHHPIRSAELLQNAQIRQMDAVRVKTSNGKERLYTGGGGVGIDAQAAYFASTTFRSLTGRFRYLLSAARALMEYRPVQVSVQIRSDDGAPSQIDAAVLLLAVLNTPSYGAGLRFAPAAIIDDGTLNLVLVEDMSLFELLRALPRLIIWGEVRSPRLKRLTVKSLTIQTDVPSLFHGDGEILGFTPVEIEVVPRAFRILCPPGSH